MTNPLCFIDTETTSLRPDRRAWEVAVITRDIDGQDTEYTWFVTADDLNLGNADLRALHVGGFYQRHPAAAPAPVAVALDEEHVLREVEALTRGTTIVGAVPDFDADVLGRRMRRHDLCPSWHYHLVDVETYAAGRLRTPPPWNFDTMLAQYGLSYNEADRHTALGDARMVRDLYDAVIAGDATTNPAGGSGD